MNTNFFATIKRIIDDQGEDVLANSQRIKGYVNDYAARESKPERLAFSRCIEHGAYTELKNAPDTEARLRVKAAVAQRVHSNEGLDVTLCNDALDVLEVAMFGEKNICKNCGKELQEGWVSCPFCGAGQTPPVQVRTAPEGRETPAVRVEWPVSEDFVHIEGGMFIMGSPSSEVDHEDDEAQHQVTVSSFYMGKYELTQAEYKAVMGTNPSYFKGDKLPVEKVSWHDAIEYCNKRSEKEGLTPAYTVNAKNVTWNKNAKGYRLPTEAEWEYACRSGTAMPFSTGNNITINQANYNGNYPYNKNMKGTYRAKTTEVGNFATNRWGLYDMHGNVWEWCWDWYGGYSLPMQSDPDGAVSGAYRVRRGGSCFNYGQHLRSAYRNYYSPGDRNKNIGFRLVHP
jgi:formylglycine-generating enzyme required for sulfatase activity